MNIYRGRILLFPLQIQDPLQFGRPPQIIGRSSLKCKKFYKKNCWSFSLFVKVMLCINSTLNMNWCFRYQFSFDVRCQSPLNLIDSLFTSTLPQCQMNSEIFAIFVSLNIIIILTNIFPLPYNTSNIIYWNIVTFRFSTTQLFSCDSISITENVSL